MSQQLEQQIAFGLDPVIHGIARDQRRGLHLVEHAQLQLGIDVSQEHVAGVPEGLGELGPEGGEHTEPRFQRFATRQVVRVARLPPERFPLGLLDAAQVDATLFQRLERAERVVAPHHADDLHRMQQRSRGAEENGRSPRRVGRLTEGRGHRV